MTMPPIIQSSRGRKSLQLFDAQEYEHLALRWKKREKKEQKDQEKSDFEFLQTSIYLSQ